MRILLIGHACSPVRGSEPAVTWNWAWYLAAEHQVRVIAHPKYRNEVEQFIKEHPNPNLTFEWVELRAFWDPWKPEKSEKGIRLHYIFWQRAALRAAARLAENDAYDLVHYVSWNSISAPPNPVRIRIPFVWGPVGGGMITPKPFMASFGSGRWKEYLRTWRVRLVRFSPALRRTIRRSSMLLATNYETRDLLLAAGAKEVEMFWDNGRPPEFMPEKLPERCSGDQMTLLWAGNLEPWKAFPLALDAFARAHAENPKIRLLVAGEGTRRREYERSVKELGLEDSVVFLGWVKWEEMAGLFQSSDAFLFTSVRDSSGSVVLEAMAFGLPIITLNHQGVGFFVFPSAGFKVPVTDPAAMADGLAGAMIRLAESPALREEMGRAAWMQAKTQASDRRAAAIARLYKDLLFKESGLQNNSATRSDTVWE